MEGGNGRCSLVPTLRRKNSEKEDQDQKLILIRGNRGGRERAFPA
jgi:hypothetical protein